MSSETKSPASEKPEPQQVAPQTAELDAEKLDEVTGGMQGTNAGTPVRPPPAPVG
jgi:hypothetical protein